MPLTKFILWLMVSSSALCRADLVSFGNLLAQAAIDRTKHKVTYDGAYTKIPYPNGDVPANKGVCTDVIVRSYRQLGIDLQKEVHEDMKANFSVYPRLYKMKRPDPNIDHRRVPNLMVYLKRQGAAKAITDNAKDYLPGDVVAWEISSGVTHIGIVTNQIANIFSNRYLIVHNIGAGDVAEDILFNWKIIGHYRWAGPKSVAKK